MNRMTKLFGLTLITLSTTSTVLLSNYHDDINMNITNVNEVSNIHLVNKKGLNFNGLYEVPLELKMRMGKECFLDKGILEKVEDTIYFTFTQVDTKSLKDVKLVDDRNIGTLIYKNDKGLNFTYTLSLEDLTKDLTYSCVVNAMNKLVNFNVSVKLDEAKYKGDSILDIGERPAKFVPYIETSAKDIELEKGSIYLLPSVKATLNKEEIKVDTKVSYLDKDLNEIEEVLVKDNKINLTKVGTYKVKYLASSDKYLTSLNNNTTKEYSFLIKSKIGASPLAKIKLDKDSSLNKDYMLQADSLSVGEEFNKIQDLLKDKSENYDVIKLTLLDTSGDIVNLDNNSKLTISFKANGYFDRNKVKVALLKDNTLINYDVTNFGRYIDINTSDFGVYVIYVEGITFNMPIYGYILIGVSSFLLVLIVIVTIIIIHIRKKKNIIK